MEDKKVGVLSKIQNTIRIPLIANNEKTTPKVTIETKLYKRRWFQLGLFVIYAAANNMQWIQLTIISNIISRYYNVSSSAVEWTSILFFVTYVVFFLPASYVMERVGLRWTCLIGATGTVIGSWIKVFGISPDRFMLLFFGQAVVASMQIFVLSVPPRLAAYWFGSREVATATAIGCFGGLAGASLMFFISPIFVRNHEGIEDIGNELLNLFLAVAIACTLITVALFLFFQDKPCLPPSEARALKEIGSKSERKRFWSSLYRIVTNRNFLLLWNSFGINMGYFNATCTLLNPLFLIHFKNGEVIAGRLGFLMTFWGNCASVVFGMILDKTKKFKSFNIFIFVFTLVGEILFAAGLIMEIKSLVFISVVLIGTFTISYGVIGYEISAEVTYPESEELCSSLLNTAQQLYGAILALVIGSLLRAYGDKAAHVFLTVILSLGLILTFFTKEELRRQNAKGPTFYDPVILTKTLKSDKIDYEMKIQYIR